MTVSIQHGTWSALQPLANEPNSLIYTCEWKPTREKKSKRSAGTQATTRTKFVEPLMAISLTLAILTQSGFTALGVGKAVTAGLANFADVWREHDPDDGVVLLETVTDKADIEGEDALECSAECMHMPFVE